MFVVDEINITQYDEWGLSLESRSSSGRRKRKEIWLLLGTMNYAVSSNKVCAIECLLDLEPGKGT